ncbi:hypothetical protein B0T17DRAFT_190354 [Bombardia bombarda]|uniref:Uncharacterized protein n=1 Tax=Bombardia bombarda TaxID=252184 RepID=A0AA39X917_9PEZI|nr:hypothetical protein B0T17DRAFT_190354 [Bombardia bombarda]
MPSKTHTHTHHRARSSIDRVFDLLADLQENQIAVLLDDLNHTTTSNVPVSQAIALFEPGSPKKHKRALERSSSPVRTLHAELQRRHSKRMSSAPEPLQRPRSSSHSSSPRQSMSLEPSIPETPPFSQDMSFDRPARPSLTLSLPDAPLERPKTATDQTKPAKPRSYKRISRPYLSPSETAELQELLLAYLYDDHPVSATTTATSSPATPDALPSRFSPFSRMRIPTEPEPDTPALGLLEPSPTRLPQPRFTFRRAGEPTESMSGIFEVLSSH